MVGPFSTHQTQKNHQILNPNAGNCNFFNFQKNPTLGALFLTKTTVLASILTFEVTDMVAQPQFELGKVPEAQSGTWGNLVPHMCKSQQTTSVKGIFNQIGIQ